MKVFSIFIFLLLLSHLLFSQACPDFGNAKNAREKTLNIRQNRPVDAPASIQPEVLPLRNLIASRKRDDSKLYKEGAYVTMQGILISSEEEGPESCNYGKPKSKKRDGDVHIYLSLVKNAPKKKCIVIEIAPFYKATHPDYENSLVKNKEESISGYLLYDYKHTANAFTTCENCTNVWRKTLWEIHPITEMNLL